MAERPTVGSFEYFISLGFFTPEEAESLVRSWSYRAPTDPAERAKHIRAGVEWERQMRLLNSDRRDGRISEEEYQARANQIDQKFSAAV